MKGINNGGRRTKHSNREKGEIKCKNNIAKLSQAQSNLNSVGWAELALIPTFTRESTEKAILMRLLAKPQMQVCGAILV